MTQFALFVRIQVVAGRAADFLQATRANHEGARSEPGNMRFDVLRDRGDDHRFYFYEVYRDEDAFRAHQQTAHYLAWKDAVAPLMAVPRQAERMDALLPVPWG